MARNLHRDLYPIAVGDSEPQEKRRSEWEWRQYVGIMLCACYGLLQDLQMVRPGGGRWRESLSLDCVVV